MLDGVSVIALLVGVIVLYAARPVQDKFQARGVRLRAEAQPHLFDELSAVARSLGDALPREVYLTVEPYLSITYRGGFMGFGSRKVVVVGLPLLVALSVAELRALLVREWARFPPTDDSGAVWVYKTYSAMLRSLSTAGRLGVPKLFQAFAKAFFRLTAAVCRRHEFVADATAARQAGAAALVGGLQEISTVVGAFLDYNGTEVDPLFNFGFLPPWAEGFTAFLSSSEGKKAAQKASEQCDTLLRIAFRTPSADVGVPKGLAGKWADFETLPPLQEHIDALNGAAAKASAAVAPRALGLLTDIASVELALFEHMFPRRKVQSIAWADVVSVAYVPSWSEEIRKSAEVVQDLDGIRIRDLPDLLDDMEAMFARFALPKRLTVGDKEAGIQNIVAKALVVALSRQGGGVVHRVGEPLELRVDGQSIKPFTLVGDLRHDSISREAWRACCDRAGIGGVDLGQTCQ